jgi:transposase
MRGMMVWTRPFNNGVKCARMSDTFIQTYKERAMRELTTIGIDIAKNFIQVHGINSKGKCMLKKRVSRDNFLAFMANLPRCLIGMEACGGAHYWAHELINLGFDVKLMSPRKVKKFVDNHKNDSKDAEACAEAVTRSNMRFVPVKTKVQMEIQALHRIRSFYIKQRTGLTNMIRGILLEMGIAIPKGKSALVKRLCILLDADTAHLSDKMKIVFQDLYDDLKRLNEEVDRHTASLETLAKKDEYCQRISTLPGIGPITATAMIAKIGNGSEFKKGRELSAYFGLVPKQHSSGEKQVLGSISKHGDRYLRQLLIHGGRSSMKAAMKKDKKTGLFEKQDEHSQWIRKLVERIGKNKTSVAVANKNARMIVALLKNQTTFAPALAH